MKRIFTTLRTMFSTAVRMPLMVFMGIPGDGGTSETSNLDDELFAAGFDEGLSSDDTKPDLDADDEAKRVADEAAAAEVETKRLADEAEAKRVAGEAAAAEAATKSTVPDVDINKLVADAVAAAVKPVEPTKEDPPAQTAEEIAAEEQYRKDWPEHAAREDRLKAELASVKELLTTTVAALEGRIAPVISSVNQTAEEKHYNAILTAHADADKIYPDVQKWIAEQPKFLQPQYIEVLEDGSTSDIIDLFTTYKKANGLLTTDTSEADRKKIEDDARKKAEEAETKSRLERMKGVTTLRTSVTAEEDPSDFDSAFEAEAKKIKVAA